MKFRVHSKTGKPFRRNGIAFTSEPKIVDSVDLKWSDAMVAALKETSTLYVEELPEAPAPKAPKV
jgi:hypothetical protein